MAFQSSKTYGHDVGLSCVFRQWRAESHCNQLHGYALSFKFTFECDELDSRNWVVDFGAMKGLKEQLQAYFDHTLVIADDDPSKAFFLKLHPAGLANVIVLPDVGCEAFAMFAWSLGHRWLQEQYIPKLLAESARVEGPEGLHLVSVEVREHGANGALYAP